MEGIQVSVEKTGYQGDISVIKVGGYIDTTTSSELERSLDALLKSGVFRIIIDLGNVDYISSAGWGIFISEIKGIRERGGDLKLARMIPDVYEVFELLEFHYILKAYDTIEDAIREFNKEAGAGRYEEEPETVPESEAAVDDQSLIPPMTELVEDEAPMTVEEKVKKLALENPDWGAGQIAGALNSAELGFIRVGKLSVWRMLRKMNLSNKEDRVRMTRSL